MTWQPGAPPHILKARAKMLRHIREFFYQRDVLEVETPLLASAGVTDPYLVNFETQYLLPGESKGVSLYLQTSPEFAMKRLLCADLLKEQQSIYQICKAFRNEEQGRFHNPEFTMLEWYRTGFDHWQLMDEMEELVSGLLNTEKFERLSYREAFQKYLYLDPLESFDLTIISACRDQGFDNFVDDTTTRDDLLQLLFTHRIEPQIGKTTPCFIYDFPAAQAALAKLSPDDPRVAQRFELYYQGVELANGFHELQSPQEQANRFEADNQRRQKLGIKPAKIDHNFLAALEHGLPDCAGVAMGLDRLLMLITEADDIDKVLGFSVDRA